MPLTPEEERELAEIDSKLESQAPQGLSSDEEQELAQIDEQLTRIDTPSATEAGARGAVQGLSFGFADEISGAVESAFTDKSYEESRDESRAAFDRAEKAHQAAFMGGEIVGGLASGIATGGAGAGMRGAAVLGGLYSLGSSNKTGTDLAKDAAIGAALGAAGEKVLRGIGKYAKGIFQNSSPETRVVAESLSNSTDDLAASLETSWLKEAYSKGFNNADEVLTDPKWHRKVQKHVLKAPDSINKIVKRAKDSLDHKFKAVELGNIDVQDEILNSKMFNDLINESKKELVGTSDASKWIKTFQDDLTNGKLVGDVSGGASFEQLNKIKRHIAATLFKNKSAGAGIGEAAFTDMQGNAYLKQFSAQLDDRLSQIDTTGTFKDVNKQFSLLKKAESVIPQGGEKASTADITSFFQNMGAGKGNNKGSVFFENLEQFDVINGTSYAQQVIQDVKPVIDNFGLTNMMSFKSNMDQATSLVFRGRALGSISPVLAPLAAGEPVILRLANQAGKISSKVANGFKIPRNIEGVMQSAPVISKKLALIEPTAAISFNKAYEAAIESGDTSELEALVTQTLTNPQSSSQFEQGIGFNGKVTSPEEAAQVRNGIMSSGRPISEKIQAVNELDSAGIIPQEPAQELPQQPKEIVLKRQDSVRKLDLVRLAEKELE